MAYNPSNNYNRGNQLAKTNPGMDLKTIANQPAMIAKFRQVLGNRAEKYISAIVTAANTNPNIKDCEPMSIMTFGMKAALLDLDPDPNFGYVAAVPYVNKGKKQAQFQMGTKGFTVLAMRSGKYTNINTGEIYSDEFDGIDIITGEVKYHYVPGGQRDQGDFNGIVGYFAYLEMTNGFKKTEYWSKEKVLAHAKRFSKSFNNGPWQTNFDAMARKTVLKYALNHYGLLSVEMMDAIKNDQSVQENFDAKTAEQLKECLCAVAKYGTSALPPKYLLKLGKLMLLKGLKFSDGVELYGKYVSNWGGEATEWRFDAVKNGEVVKSVIKKPGQKAHIEVEVSSTELYEGDTYDVAAVRIYARDELGNSAVYYQEPVILSCSDGLEIIGPHVISLKGGCGGTYVKTTGTAGNAELMINDIKVGFIIK